MIVHALLNLLEGLCVCARTRVCVCVCVCVHCICLCCQSIIIVLHLSTLFQATQGDSYNPLAPTQPPINPPYKTACLLKRDSCTQLPSARETHRTIVPNKSLPTLLSTSAVHVDESLVQSVEAISLPEDRQSLDS